MTRIMFWTCHGIECFAFKGFHSCDLRHKIGNSKLLNCISLGCDFNKTRGTVKDLNDAEVNNAFVLIDETVE
jgi:hypothetical protein